MRVAVEPRASIYFGTWYLRRAAFMFAGLTALVACSKQSVSEEAPSESSATEVSALAESAPPPQAAARAPHGGSLRAALQAAHRAADTATSGGERRRAAGQLEETLKKLEHKTGLGVTWAQQDALFRVGQLRLQLGDLKAAERACERGLSLQRGQTLPVANLLELQGRIFEQQGRKAAAAEAYHEALLVNQKLMQQSLEGSVGAGERP